MIIMKKLLENKSEKGTILIALIVLIVLSAVVFSTAIYNLANIMDKARIKDTELRLRRVQTAVVGNPDIFQNDAGGNLGYVGSNGSLPASISNLSSLTPSFQGLDSTYDAYGNQFVFANSGGDFITRSKGKDGTAGTGDDIELAVEKNSVENVDIQIQIMDASVSGDLNASYIRDDNTSGTYDGEYDGHVILDDDNIKVSMFLTCSAPSGTSGAYHSGTKTFRWNNIPAGWRTFEIQANNDVINPYNDYFDHKWSPIATSKLLTSIFIPPGSSTGRKHFNVVYPIMAMLDASTLRETGSGIGVVSNNHDDLVVDQSGNCYDSLAEDSVTGTDTTFLAVGWFDPPSPLVGDDRFRSVISFDLTLLPNVSNASKIVDARLRLFRHADASSTPRMNNSSNGYVQVYRYKNSWTEGSALQWSDVQSGQYSDLQDSWQYDGSAFHDFQVLEAVRNWVTGTWSNYGLILVYSTTSTGAASEVSGQYWTCKSHDAVNILGTDTNQDERPLLMVAYYP